MSEQSADDTSALDHAQGVTRVRCNGGAVIPVQAMLRVSGGTLADQVALRSTQVARVDGARVRIDVTIDGDDIPQFNPTGWSTADDVYITATADGARIAGFGLDPATQRKQLIIVGAHAVRLTNYYLEDDDPSFDDPGRIRGRARTLSPGDAARLVLDATDSRWLVNDGMFSGEYITHDNEPITHDGDPITTF